MNKKEILARLKEIDKIGKKHGTLNRDELIEYTTLQLRLGRLKSQKARKAERG